MNGADSSEAESEATRQENTFGHSYYARIYRTVESRNPEQHGVYGQWTKGYIGEVGGWWAPWESIEGGLFSADKMGHTKFPVYMMGAATHGYSPLSDTGGGWGFFERMLSCDYLSRITLTNQMVVPPALSFDDDQDEHTADGGIYLGMGQAALPILGGAHRTDPFRAVGGMNFSADNPLLTWSWIIETEQVHGPITANLPHHFFREMGTYYMYELQEHIDDKCIDDVDDIYHIRIPRHHLPWGDPKDKSEYDWYVNCTCHRSNNFPSASPPDGRNRFGGSYDKDRLDYITTLWAFWKRGLVASASNGAPAHMCENDPLPPSSPPPPSTPLVEFENVTDPGAVFDRDRTSSLNGTT